MSRPDEPIAVTVVTVAREEPYLARTLASLGDGSPVTLMVGSPETAYLGPLRGDPRLRVVAPSPGEYAAVADRPLHDRWAWNFWRALCDGQHRRRLLLVEDDVRFALGWREFLERVVGDVERDRRDYILSLYAPYDLGDTAGRRFVAIDGRGFYGTQAVLFAGDAAPAFAEHLFNRRATPGRKPCDILLGDWTVAVGLPLLTTVPSLVQHLGARSSGLSEVFHTSPHFAEDLRGGS